MPCPAGQYSKAEDKTCSPCALNHYQPDWGSSHCHHCPHNTTTAVTGATLITMCEGNLYFPLYCYQYRITNSLSIFSLYHHHCPHNTTISVTEATLITICEGYLYFPLYCYSYSIINRLSIFGLY